jgi:hypothetical protein
MRRMKVIMKNLKRIWLAVAMSCIVTASVFAIDQGNGQKPPPPPKKEHPLVVVPDKKPPQNDGGKKGGDDKRGKP